MYRKSGKGKREKQTEKKQHVREGIIKGVRGSERVKKGAVRERETTQMRKTALVNGLGGEREGRIPVVL